MGDLHVGLVDLPAITDGMAARPSSVGQQRREPQHPAVDRDMVDLDPALGQQLLDIAIGQGEAQVSADGEDDDIGWEAEAGEGGPRSGSRARAVGSHIGSLAARTRRRGCNSAWQPTQGGEKGNCRARRHLATSSSTLTEVHDALIPPLHGTRPWRKPAKAESCTEAGHGWRGLMATVCVLGTYAQQMQQRL